jgi:RNA polymerase sigma factor (TIGR02999 family)
MVKPVMIDGQFTQLLHAARDGDNNARSQLLPQVYEELQTLARHHMRRENAGHTLQATALINEAYIRLQGVDEPNDRAHFLALSAQAMRRVLVDHARSRKREKRGGDLLRVTLSDWQAETATSEDALVDLDDALRRLGAFDARPARAVELLFFGGLTYEEIGRELGISKSAAFDDIKAAKAWLAAEMS